MATSASTLHKCRVCKDEDHKKKKKLVIRFVPSVNGIDYGMFDSIAVAISPTTKLTVLWTHTGFLCSAFSLPRLISINFNVQEHMISNVSIERFTNKAVFLTSPQAYNMRWSICTIGFRSAKWNNKILELVNTNIIHVRWCMRNKTSIFLKRSSVSFNAQKQICSF